MALLSSKCPSCGASVKSGAKFCGNCGTRVPTSEHVCPQCKAVNKGGASFCAGCGAALPAPTGQGTLWKRAEGDFVSKVALAAADIHKQRNITVEHGTRALVFADGRYIQDLGPGSYDVGPEPPESDLAHKTWATMRKLLEKIGVAEEGKAARNVIVTALLVDEGDLEMGFDASAWTRDPIKVDVETRVALGVTNAANLFVNLMKGRNNYTTGELRGELFDEVENALSESLGKFSAFELGSNLELKSRIADDVRSHLSQTLGRFGLEFRQVRTLNFSHKVLDEQQKVKEVLLLQASKQEAINAGRRRLADALDETELQKIAREAKAIELRERRLQNILRLRRLALSNQTDKLRHEFEMRKADITASEEMEELVRAFTGRKEDQALARRNLVQRLELEQELELKAIELTRKGELTGQALDQQIQRERAKRVADLEAQKEAAIAEAEREGVRLGTIRKKADLAMSLREQKIALDHKEESDRIAREERQKEAEARREIEKIMALSEVEQSRLAADLKKAESLKDLSEEKIMALMAERSPHVASAIAERYKAQAQAGASSEVRALYDKILAGKETEADRMERIMAKAIESVERAAGGAVIREREQKQEIKDVTGQAMGDMAQVAGARAGASGSATAANVICPRCKRPVAAGAKFCDNCGHQLFE